MTDSEKSFTEVAESISEIVKKPLSKQEVQEIVTIMENNKENTVKQADSRTDIEKAIDTINKALEEDQGYHYAWQSNIAMAFQDELSRRGYKLPDQHAISNEAAKNFLNNLMSHSKKR